MRHFLAEVEAGGPVPRSDVYVTLGRGEMRAGRSLESLLTAYRLGARVAWRRFAAAGVQAGVEPQTLYLLAESVFAYIDTLSAESAAGAIAESAMVSISSNQDSAALSVPMTSRLIDGNALATASGK